MDLIVVPSNKAEAMSATIPSKTTSIPGIYYYRHTNRKVSIWLMGMVECSNPPHSDDTFPIFCKKKSWALIDASDFVFHKARR